MNVKIDISQALYRPGSGPLRKSGRVNDECDNENIVPADRQKQPQHFRQKQGRFEAANDSKPPSQMDGLATKFNDVQISYKDSPPDNYPSSSRNHSGEQSADRKKSKKPEQALYVPKKVKEALAERDVANR